MFVCCCKKMNTAKNIYILRLLIGPVSSRGGGLVCILDLDWFFFIVGGVLQTEVEEVFADLKRAKF